MHGLALVDQPRYNADTVNKIHEIARNSVLDLALANHHEAHDELEALEAVHFVALEYVVSVLEPSVSFASIIAPLGDRPASSTCSRAGNSWQCRFHSE